MEATTMLASHLIPKSTPARATGAQISMTMPLSKIRSSKSTIWVSRVAWRTIISRNFLFELLPPCIADTLCRVPQWSEPNRCDSKIGTGPYGLLGMAYVPHSSRKGISGQFTVARGAKVEGSILPKKQKMSNQLPFYDAAPARHAHTRLTAAIRLKRFLGRPRPLSLILILKCEFVLQSPSRRRTMLSPSPAGPHPGVPHKILRRKHLCQRSKNSTSNSKISRVDLRSYATRLPAAK